MNLAALPLIKSDSEVGLAECQAYKRHGYHAINFQTQNDYLIRDFDLRPAKAAGLSAGVWGVTYRSTDFYRDGKRLAESALRLGAEHLTMDVEFALKNTRADRGAQPIIDGVRAGGWRGPVHLNTLGGPVHPKIEPNGGGNDYGFDYESFLATGGGVFLQCYFNMADEYRPLPSMLHAIACGVPRERLNATISLAYSEPWAPKPTTRLSGAEWVPLLREAGVTRNLSIFLARSIQHGDLEGLDALTLAPAPAPAPVPAPEPTPEEILIAKLNMANTGVNAVLDRVERLFDRQIIGDTSPDPVFEDPDGVDAMRKYLLALGSTVNALVDEVAALRASR